MSDNPAHFTPLPDDVIPIKESSFGAKNKVTLIVLGLLVMVALILGVLYYLNNSSVQPGPKDAIMTPSTPVTQPSPLPGDASDEVNIFSDDASTQELSCGDWPKYEARLKQIGMTCRAGCCPPGAISGCSAPAEGECKPKGNPCSDGTCWECRFRSGLQLLRYRDGQWVSCTTPPTPTPTIPPIAICSNPNQCLPLNDCETPPSTTNPNAQCANKLYCCKPKTKIAPTLSPTPPACVKPKLDIEVECLQCDGEATTQ